MLVFIRSTEKYLAGPLSFVELLSLDRSTWLHKNSNHDYSSHGTLLPLDLFPCVYTVNVDSCAGVQSIPLGSNCFLAPGREAKVYCLTSSMNGTWNIIRHCRRKHPSLYTIMSQSSFVPRHSHICHAFYTASDECTIGREQG